MDSFPEGKSAENSAIFSESTSQPSCGPSLGNSTPNANPAPKKEKTENFPTLPPPPYEQSHAVNPALINAAFSSQLVDTPGVQYSSSQRFPPPQVNILNDTRPANHDGHPSHPYLSTGLPRYSTNAPSGGRGLQSTSPVAACAPTPAIASPMLAQPKIPPTVGPVPAAPINVSPMQIRSQPSTGPELVSSTISQHFAEPILPNRGLVPQVVKQSIVDLTGTSVTDGKVEKPMRALGQFDDAEGQFDDAENDTVPHSVTPRIASNDVVPQVTHQKVPMLVTSQLASNIVAPRITHQNTPVIKIEQTKLLSDNDEQSILGGIRGKEARESEEISSKRRKAPHRDDTRREPPTKITFSLKDWEYAYTSLSGFDDLLEVLPEGDCQFLAESFWIFSAQQLEYVLFRKLSKKTNKNLPNTMSAEQQITEVDNVCKNSQDEKLLLIHKLKNSNFLSLKQRSLDICNKKVSNVKTTDSSTPDINTATCSSDTSTSRVTSQDRNNEPDIEEKKMLSNEAFRPIKEPVVVISANVAVPTHAKHIDEEKQASPEICGKKDRDSAMTMDTRSVDIMPLNGKTNQNPSDNNNEQPSEYELPTREVDDIFTKGLLHGNDISVQSVTAKTLKESPRKEHRSMNSIPAKLMLNEVTSLARESSASKLSDRDPQSIKDGFFSKNALRPMAAAACGDLESGILINKEQPVKDQKGSAQDDLDYCSGATTCGETVTDCTPIIDILKSKVQAEKKEEEALSSHPKGSSNIDLDSINNVATSRRATSTDSRVSKDTTTDDQTQPKQEKEPTPRSNSGDRSAGEIDYNSSNSEAKTTGIDMISTHFGNKSDNYDETVGDSTPAVDFGAARSLSSPQTSEKEEGALHVNEVRLIGGAGATHDVDEIKDKSLEQPVNPIGATREDGCNAEQQIKLWEISLVAWRKRKGTMKKKKNPKDQKKERTDFSLEGPLSCLLPIATRQFLESMSITSAFRFLSTKKTEGSALIYAFTTWREKCDLPVLKNAALARHMIGVALRIEKAITLVPPASEYTRTWMGSALVILTGGAKEFLIDHCKLEGENDVLRARTKDLADRLVIWRETRNLPILKGSGKVAMVSGWKASLKEATEAETGVGEVLSKSDLLGQTGTKDSLIIQSTKTLDESLNSPKLQGVLKGEFIDFLSSQGITTVQQLVEVKKTASSSLVKKVVKLREAGKLKGTTDRSSAARTMSDWTQRIKEKLACIHAEGLAKVSKKRSREADSIKTSLPGSPNKAELQKDVVMEKREGQGMTDRKTTKKGLKPKIKKRTERRDSPYTLTDSIDSLSNTTREFLATLGITTGEKMLLTKTSRIATSFIEWRELNNMAVLKGYGAIASVSAWKAAVRKAAAENGWEHVLDRVPYNKYTKEGKKSLTPTDPERNAGVKIIRPKKLKPVSMVHPEVLLGLSTRDFSVSNLKGGVYDFELSVRRPERNSKRSISFPPDIGIYLHYKGVRKCDSLPKSTSIFAESTMERDYDLFPILVDVPTTDASGEISNEIDGTKCDILGCVPFSSRRQSGGVIDLAKYGVFPSCGEDRAEKLKRYIKDFICEVECCRAGDNAFSRDKTPFAKTGPVLDSSHANNAVHDYSKNQSVQHGNAVNIFLRESQHGPLESLLFLDEPIEKGQIIELRFDQHIRDINQKDSTLLACDDKTLQMRLEQRLSNLSKVDLMMITDFLSEISDPILFDLSKVSEILIEKGEGIDVNHRLKNILISRRRLHWVADRIKKQFNFLDSLQETSNAPAKKVRRRNLNACLWKPDINVLLTSIPGNEDSKVFKYLLREIKNEMLVSLTNRGILKRPFDFGIWCKTSSNLLHSCLECISTQLLRGSANLVESQNLLMKSLESLILKSIKSLLAPDKDLMDFTISNHPIKCKIKPADIKIYQDAMCLCGEEFFEVELYNSSSLLANTLVATESLVDGEESGRPSLVMRKVADVVSENIPFHMQWYLHNQIIPVVNAVTTGGFIDWNTMPDSKGVTKSMAPYSVLILAIKNAFPIFSNLPTEIICVDALETVRIDGLNLTAPVPSAPSSIQLFLGLVWPKLHGMHGWKIDAGNVPLNILFLMPGGKNRLQNESKSAKIQKERRRKRARCLEQLNDVCLLKLTKEMKAIFVSLLEQDLKKEDCMSDSDEEQDFVQGSIVCAKKALESFLEKVIETLSSNGEEGGRGRMQAVGGAISACFNTLVPQLMYPFEIDTIDQDNVITAKYGAEHFLRFLIILPRLLQESGLPIKQLEDTTAVLKELTHFFSTRLESLFHETLQLPKDKYADKIVGPEPFIVPRIERLLLEDRNRLSETQQSLTTGCGKSTVDGELVQPEDKPLLTDFTELVMKQVITYHATNIDLLKKGRRNIRIGLAGIVCRHCLGVNGEGKYFFSTRDSLGTAATVVLAHMNKCPNISGDIEPL